MSLWNNPPYDPSLSKMPTSSTVNPLEMFSSCAISDISVGDATIHTLYRPAQPDASDIVLVMIHGYPQPHVMWRSVYPQLTLLMQVDVYVVTKGDGSSIDGSTRIRSIYETRQKFPRR